MLFVTVLIATLLITHMVTRLLRHRLLSQQCQPHAEPPPPQTKKSQRSWAPRRQGPALPLLPEGHRPPVGLGPLSPSERFLTTESSRGIRDLEAFLSN